MNSNPSKAALIIAYRRYANLQSQVKCLIGAGITKIYIAVDAAPANDLQAGFDVSRTLEIAQNIHVQDEEIRIVTHDSNVGCSAGVLSACDWFFSNENFGVILEDDCIPSPDFFEYVYSARSHLRLSENWLICGTQFAPQNLALSDWMLSKYPLIWGWATTRDKWKEIAVELKNGAIGNWDKKYGKSDYQYWHAGARRSSQGHVDAWDNILVYRMLLTSKYAILPRQTLVTNIGSDHVATHTSASSKWLSLETGSFKVPNTSPVINEAVDSWLRNNFYKISIRHQLTTRLTSLKDKLKRGSSTSLLARWEKANKNLIEIYGEN